MSRSRSADYKNGGYYVELTIAAATAASWPFVYLLKGALFFMLFQFQSEILTVHIQNIIFWKCVKEKKIFFQLITLYYNLKR